MKNDLKKLWENMKSRAKAEGVEIAPEWVVFEDFAKFANERGYEKGLTEILHIEGDPYNQNTVTFISPTPKPKRKYTRRKAKK